MTPDERLRAAKALQTNPLLPEILEEMQLNTVRAWRSSDDPEKRNALWYQDKAITQLRSNIHVAIRNAGGDTASTATAGE